MSELLELAEDVGSFRDPSGRVFTMEGRVLRTVTARAAESYEQLCRNGVLARLAEEGRIVDSAEVDPATLGLTDPDVRHVLEHPAIPYVSYPYEWPFPALKAAALAHLDLHLQALDAGATLTDASAYNMQFKGTRPIFIDVLSLRPYRDGEYWIGHRQFCEQFLNPLLLRAVLGVAHNAWYRGRLEGIPTADLARLLPLRRKLSWNVLSHVVLQARLEAAARRRPEASVSAVRGRTLSRTAFRGLLLQLRRWIARLEPADTGPTVWGDYAETHSYEAGETDAKRRFVAEFVDRVRPRLAFDLGCNTGEFSALALEAGAAAVIGFDFDQRALERAFARAAAQDLAFLPLFLDAADPTPDQGWRQGERQGFDTRARADAILALAFAHHLAIGRNVPLDQLLVWLTGLAPQGVIEFVPKEDPTVRQMLALREDIFERYGEHEFESCLARCACIVRSTQVSAHGRRLYWYERK